VKEEREREQAENSRKWKEWLRAERLKNAKTRAVEIRKLEQDKKSKDAEVRLHFPGSLHESNRLQITTSTTSETMRQATTSPRLTKSKQAPPTQLDIDDVSRISTQGISDCCLVGIER